jgi:hypothetical protein
MSQRVEYEAMPGARYDQYAAKVRAIARFVSTSEGTPFKTFRDFLRKQGLWDRQKSPVMLSLIDLTWDRQTVQVGAFAKKLQGVESDDVARDLLFRRLEKDNVLLLKYVMEALDVETGGRLHSVHELYRMVTSYVYPGDYVTLPNFQAWVEWLAATGYIKMIGIRWGLSDAGREVIHEFTSLDIEELLEDMAEAELVELAEHDGVAVPDSAASTDSPAAADTTDGHGAEDILDGVVLDAEPKPADVLEDLAEVARPRQGRPAPVATSLHPPSGASEPLVRRVAGPASTAPIHEPITSLRPPTSVAIVTESADVAAAVERIKGWHAQWHGWPAMTAQVLGIDTGPEGTEGDELLVEVAVLAALVEGIPAQPQVFAAARRVRQAGFFAALHGAGGFAAAIDALGDVDDEPWLRALSERLMHARGICARVAAEPGAMARLSGAESGAAAARMLRHQIFGGAGTEAPFWVLRELVRDGMLDGPRFADATTVPTARLLANAARIGLIPSADITSFDGLVAASAAVSAHFGADAGYGVALEVMDRALGLATTSP